MTEEERQGRAASPAPEKDAAPQPDAVPKPDAEPDRETDVEPDVEAAGEGAADGATPGVEPQVEPRTEPEPEPQVEPSPDVEPSAEPVAVAGEEPVPDPEAAPDRTKVVVRARRRRDPLAAALIGVLTLLLGFAFAVQVRNVGTDQALSGAREEDLVRILDDLNAREERLREQISDQRTALSQLTSTDSQSATALQEAQKRAEAIGILNGTVAAQGPGMTMTVRDPAGAVRVADVLDAIEELRGAGAETMQIDGIRVGVSSAVTGTPGNLMLDGRPITSPYEFVVIGSPQDMETAMKIPGGVAPRFVSRGATVDIKQSDKVVVDALRPLDVPQYASPNTGH